MVHDLANRPHSGFRHLVSLATIMSGWFKQTEELVICFTYTTTLLRGHANTYLLERNAETLHTHGGLLLAIGARLLLLALGQVLDALFTARLLAERNKHDVARIQGRDDLLPLSQDQAVRLEGLIRLVVHVFLDSLQELRDLRSQVSDGDRALRSGIAASITDDRLGSILGTELETKGNTLQLPVGELVTRGAIRKDNVSK